MTPVPTAADIAAAEAAEAAAKEAKAKAAEAAAKEAKAKAAGEGQAKEAPRGRGQRMNLLSSVLSPQTVATFAFVVVVALTLVGALIAVAARNIFHNVLGLAASLLGVSGLFLYLNSPFVALMEILIYVGAICIAICFAIMLSEPLHLPRPPRSKIKILGAVVGAGRGLRLPGPAGQEDQMGPGRWSEARTGPSPPWAITCSPITP